jgi:glycerophosphoryl diester phosphodiesterase
MTDKPTTPPRPLPGWLTSLPIAHRGLHALPNTPENSLAAFEAAAVAGYPIELDVRLNADGQVAVFHDNTLDRTTGATGPFAACTTADLRTLRLLGTDQHIPLLSEALELVAGRVPFLIEIKNEPANVGPLEAATLEALAGYTGEYAIQSFSTATVAYLAANAPHIIRGQLSSTDNWKANTPEGEPAPDFLAYQLNALPSPVSNVYRDQGIPLIAWTIHTLEQQARAIEVADNYIFEFVLPEVG